MTLPFRRVLVANRGEIAVRIIRACRELGLEAVAVYSDTDRSAAHVRMADVAVRLGPAAPTESYLRIDRVLEAAAKSGAEAIHPGYGFLAERAEFARQAQAAGLVFIGPDAGTIDALGDKLHARRLAKDAGVPIVPGTLEPATIDGPDGVDAVVRAARDVGFPLLVKAAAGGGGRGMRRVTRPADLPTALLEGSREAQSAFGDGRVYLEREIRPARHIEVQLLGDVDGRIVALGERDCSLQRRHQKLVEEAPAPGLTVEERTSLHGLAVAMATAARLTNAATAEFLREPDGQVRFLEVNTRLQVEHGVTELVSGVDIVREQLLLAAGRPLSSSVVEAAGRAASPGSHAIEVRIAAEDPGRDFAPAPGRVRHWVLPSGPGIRVDTALEAGERVAPEYDNLIAKVMVHAGNRDAAIDRLARAVDETHVAGIQTTLPFHRFVARSDHFRAGNLSTEWVAEHWDAVVQVEPAQRLAMLAAAIAWGSPATDGAAASGAGSAAGHGPTSAGEQAGVLAQRHLAEASGSGGLGETDGAARGRAGRERTGWDAAALEAGVDRWPGE